MKNCRRVICFVFAAVFLSGVALSSRAETRVVAYVPNWVDLKTYSKTIDYGKLTHINLAFENATNAAGDLSFDRKDQALIDAAHAAGVKVLVSIGGGSASTDKTLQERYNVLMTEKNRPAWVTAVAAYLDKHGYDGIDIDIEGPSIGKDYGPFIAELSPALKKNGKLLTAALSRDYGGKKVPAETLKLFDFVNIMAYDGAGPWDPEIARAAFLHGLREAEREILARPRTAQGKRRPRRAILRLRLRQGFPQGRVRLQGYRRQVPRRRKRRPGRRNHLVQRDPHDPGQNAVRAEESAWRRDDLGTYIGRDGDNSLLGAIHTTIAEAAATQKAK